MSEHQEGRRDFVPSLSLPMLILALGAIIAPLGDAAGQCPPNTLLQTIPNPALTASDHFGYSVAISGNLAVVGGFNNNNSEEAYVFNATSGALVTVLNSPASTANGMFGLSVAINGNLAVVGAFVENVNGVTKSGAAYVFNATTGALVSTLNNPAPAEVDTFGNSVAISGNLAVVGTPYDDPDGVTDSGTAYVFDAMTGTLVAALNNPAPTASDRFGVSVGIDGNLAVVGADYDDPVGIKDAGSAYVFDAASGALVATLNNPSPSADNSFGFSVAVSGNVAIVGASNAGVTYIFNATNGALTATLNNPAPAPDDHFGYSVSIFGNVTIVGAVLDDPSGITDVGSAYVFNATTGALVETLNKPMPMPRDLFGASVAISGNTAIVGAYFDDPSGVQDAGSVYTFTCASLIPTPTPTSVPCPPDTLLKALNNPAPTELDGFGYSVAVSGNVAVVGAYTDDPSGIADAGTAYVFNAMTGALTITLNNPDPTLGDIFGNSVSISGNLAVVGAPYDDDGGTTNTGTAYTFNVTTGALIATLNDPAPEVNAHFGYSVAISGNLAVVGAYSESPSGISGAGSAYVFNASTGAIIATLNNPTPTVNDNFGVSVSLSGNLTVVGASWEDSGEVTDSGSAYVFNAISGTLVATLNNPDPMLNGQFGYAVAISGNLAAVGAYNDSSGGVPQAGSAYVFNATTGALVNTLDNPAPEAGDGFGNSIAISGNVVAVGVYSDNPAGVAGAGTAYVFNAANGTLVSTLNNPEPGAGDWFGYAVAVSGNVALVGVLYDNPGGATNVGSAYVFTCGEPTPTTTPTPTVTPTPSPTPTETPTPSPTPTPTPLFVQGYYPAPGGVGEAITFFEDYTPPNPAFRSYRIQVRRVDDPSVLVHSIVFNLPDGPGLVESHSSQFSLPLLDALIPTSWEIDAQYKTQAFGGQNATGATLFNAGFSYALHPSADVSDAPVLMLPPVIPAPGVVILHLTDNRPTAKKGAYRYDIIRAIQFGPETQVGQSDHGILGPFPTSAVHLPVTRSLDVPIVNGDLSFYVRTRREFRNSFGTSLGRFDIAPQSPAVGLIVNEP